MPHTIVITGMHRSGTSLIASLLQKGGVNVGDNLLMPNKHNPRGFFEDVDFYDFHERALCERGKTVFADRDFEFDPTQDEIERASQLITSRENLPVWGWKDPRTSLFLEFWRKLLPDACFLLVYRHPLEVLLSLLRRGDLYSCGMLDGIDAWHTYNSRIKEFYEQHSNNTLLCHPYSVIDDFSVFIEALNRKFGLDIQMTVEDLESLYRPDELRRFHVTRDVELALRMAHPKSCELYEYIDSIADLPSATESPQGHHVDLSAFFDFAATIPGPGSVAGRRALLFLLVSMLEPEVIETFFDGHNKHIKELANYSVAVEDDRSRVYSSLTQQQDQLRDQQRQIDLLQEQLTGSKTAHRQVVEDLQRREGELNDLRVSHQQVMEDLRRREGELNDLRVSHQQVMEDLQRREGELNDLRVSHQQVMEDLRRRDEQVREQTHQLVRWQAENDHLQLQFDEARFHVEALQKTRTVRFSRTFSIFCRGLGILAGAIFKRDIGLPTTMQNLLAHALGNPIQGAVDLPERKSEAVDHVMVAGWAFSTAAPIRRVDVLLTDTNDPVGTVPFGLARPDVIRARPWQREIACGYAGVVELRSVSPGLRRLTIRVTDVVGNQREFMQEIVVRRASRVNDHNLQSLPAVEAVSSAAVQAAHRVDGPSLESLSKSRLNVFLASGRRMDFLQVDAPLVSIVIPTMNKVHYTFALLESLLGSDNNAPFEVVVVDNASTDETQALLAKLEHVRVHLNECNAGFGEACNLGAELARGDYVCFLNSDTLVTPSWLSTLVRTLESYPKCGAVGCKLIHLNGRLQEAGGIIWRDGSTHGYGRGEDPLGAEYSYVREVDYCSAACLLVRRDLFLQVGGFDARYAPAYYEDTDLCMALRDAGYKVVYQPSATVFHIEYGSSDANQAVSLHIRNREKFVRKWSAKLEEHQPPDTSRQLAARDRRSGRRVLVIDDRIPHAYWGSGFPRAGALLHALADLGYVVTFLPREPSPDGPITIAMQQRGIEVLYGASDTLGVLEERAKWYDVVIVSRPHNAGLLGPIRQLNPNATIIYDAEAVYTLRDVLQAQVEGRELPPDAVESMLRTELASMDMADVIVTVSNREQDIVQQYKPNVSVTVWGHPVTPRTVTADFHDRRDLLYVGYLATPPNADALRHFLLEIFPKIRSRCDCRLIVAGAEPSVELSALATTLGDSVEMLGYVEDLTPVYDRCRVFVAPHRFAAGVPLKVVEAMAHGIPCVISQLLGDQLEITDEVEAFVAENADEFIDKVIRLYEDIEAWDRIQRNAHRFVADRYDPKVMREALRDCIDGAVMRKNGSDRGDTGSSVGYGTTTADVPASGPQSSSSVGDFVKTIEYWSTRPPSKEQRERWQAHPILKEAMSRRRGGLSVTGWLAQHLHRRGRAAGLGVGMASGELDLLRLNAVDTFDLYEIAPALLQGATQAAQEAGVAERIRCHVADINKLELEAESYDLITFFSSLHHVEELEYVLSHCRQALRPGGVLFADEYVGPDRFAFPDEHLRLARAIYATVDPKLRCPWPEMPVPNPVDVAAADPTESVRSSEIIDVVRRYFPDVKVLSLDVALTTILWYGLNHDALYETEEGHNFVRWLLETDQELIRSGQLWSYHAMLLAIKGDT